MSASPFTDPLPEYVDARKAFNNERMISGYIAVSRLERLCQSLATKDGEVRARFEFVVDSGGRRRIKGHVSGSVWLACQRCLDSAALDLDEQVDLVLVANELEAQALDKTCDPWICDDHRIVLADLIDEQMLLGLPIVYFHESERLCRSEVIHGAQRHGRGAPTGKENRQ